MNQNHVTLWSAVMLSHDEPESSDTMDPNHVTLWPWILILLNLFPIHSDYYHHCCFYPILVKCILYKGANVYCTFIYSWCVFLFLSSFSKVNNIFLCWEKDLGEFTLNAKYSLRFVLSKIQVAWSLLQTSCHTS